MTVNSINFICLDSSTGNCIFMHFELLSDLELSLFLVHAVHLNLYFHLKLQHKFVHPAWVPFPDLLKRKLLLHFRNKSRCASAHGPCSLLWGFIMFKSTDTQGIKTTPNIRSTHFRPASGSLIRTWCVHRPSNTFGSCCTGRRISCYLISQT
jgi:hypothetical protein